MQELSGYLASPDRKSQVCSRTNQSVPTACRRRTPAYIKEGGVCVRTAMMIKPTILRCGHKSWSDRPCSRDGCRTI